MYGSCKDVLLLCGLGLFLTFAIASPAVAEQVWLHCWGNWVEQIHQDQNGRFRYTYVIDVDSQNGWIYDPGSQTVSLFEITLIHSDDVEMKGGDWVYVVINRNTLVYEALDESDDVYTGRCEKITPLPIKQKQF